MSQNSLTSKDDNKELREIALKATLTTGLSIYPFKHILLQGYHLNAKFLISLLLIYSRDKKYYELSDSSIKLSI